MKTLILLCLFLTAAVAGDAMPASAQALIDKSEADVAKIHADLAAKLAKQQDIATKKGDLSGAMAIKARIEELSKATPAGEGPVSLKQRLSGTFSFAFPNGHAGQIEIGASGADVPGYHGGVTFTDTASTITWSNGSQWAITVHNDKIIADCSDGRSTLTPVR